MMHDVFKDIKESIRVGEKLIKEICFEDDKAIVLDSNKGLQKLVSSLDMTMEKYDTKLNIKQTKVMRISRKRG